MRKKDNKKNALIRNFLRTLPVAQKKSDDVSRHQAMRQRVAGMV